MSDERAGAALDPALEASLWRRAGEGDDVAREQLILAYRPMVFWMAKKFRVAYGVYPDLVQEGMMGLISAVDKFDAARSNRFITYAYYKVRGMMANFLNRSEGRAPLPVEDERLDRPDSFARDIDRMEWKLAVRGGMSALPEKELEVVRSLIFDGRKAAEVAAEQGVNVSSIYRMYSRALKRLRKWLASGGEPAEA